MSSYDVVDRFFAALGDARLYPNLKRVVLAGFSAGGQFAGRYAAVGKGVVRDGVELAYAAMAPSTEFRFTRDFAWHYGLKDRPRYSAGLTDEQIYTNLCSRRVWRGCGELDVKGRPHTSLDSRPPAMAQGTNRYDRFCAFARHLEAFPAWKRQVTFHTFRGIGHKSPLAYADPVFLEFVLHGDSRLPVTPAQMRGPFPILSTPYFEDGAIDYEALAAEARFVADSGCPGVIWGQSNDAVDLVTREERRRCFETCAKALEGRDITLALGANGTNTVEMLEIAADIEAVAAQHPKTRLAMISRPPDDVRSEAAIEAAWTALAGVAKRPVIFQTYGTKETPTPSVELLIRLAKEHPDVFGYVKEEAAGYAAVERMAKLSAAKPVIKSAMAGWGGWQWLLQLRHCGSDGLVTERAAFAPILAKIWRVRESGETGLPLTEAFAMYRLLCDQRNFPSGLRGYPLYLLQKEGIFKNRVSRQYVREKVTEGGSFGVGPEWKLTNVKLNDLQMKELDLLYEEMLRYAAR